MKKPQTKLIAPGRRSENRRLSILNIIGGLNPESGGPPSSAQNIWISAQRAGLSISAVYMTVDAPTSGELRAIDRLHTAGVKLQSFRRTQGPNAFIRWGVSLRYAAWILRAAKDYDVIHGHSAWMFSSFIGLLAARLAGTPYVIMPHESMTEHDIYRGSSRIKHRLKRFMKSLYLKYSSCMIVASELEARDSVYSGSSIDCHVLYHPVFEERAVAPVPRRWPAKIRQLKVGYLGRFHAKKNIELLIRAVADLKGISLHVGGSGTKHYQTKLLMLAESCKLGKRIHWLGFIPAERRTAFLDTLDVLVMPSDYECFGMVAAEALVEGVPVIVSERTGISELIARYDCGIIVPPTLESIRSAIEKLRRNPERLETFSRHAVNLCRREFAFDVYGKKIAAIYRELISQQMPST
jgi:glycosyltransferase involved in cell wall biosynthesis